MAFEVPKTAYSGKIKNITLGKEDKAVTVGGETSYPFYLFEGEMPNLPKIAMEVYDTAPEEWPEAALEPFAGVTEDPVTWANKCINDYGAEMICLQLLSTDPNGEDRGAEEAAHSGNRRDDHVPFHQVGHSRGKHNQNDSGRDKLPDRDFHVGPG